MPCLTFTTSIGLLIYPLTCDVMTFLPLVTNYIKSKRVVRFEIEKAKWLHHLIAFFEL